MTDLTLASPWRIVTLAILPGYRLQVCFQDGTDGVVDLSAFVQAPDAGVFAVLHDPVAFAQAYLEMGVVTWPGGLDIAPDAMYTEILRSAENLELCRREGDAPLDPGVLDFDDLVDAEEFMTQRLKESSRD